MLKKFMKPALTLVLCVVVLLSVPSMAFADGSNALSIRREEETLELSPALLQEGRTYVPYDALFEALGAQSGYDEQTETITAVLGDTEISIEIDDYYISLTTGGVQQWVYTGSPAIIDTTGSTIFVPLRYTAQALGYVVSWDEDTRCIELMPLEQLIDENGATYTVMDKYLDFMNEFNAQCHRVDGDFGAEIDLMSLLTYYYYDDAPDKIEPLSISGTVSGIIDPGGEEMSLNLTTNLSEVMVMFSELYEEELDEESQALYEQLDDVDISLIVNNEDGMLYIKSPLFSAFADVSEDTWISVETDESLLLSDILMTSVIATEKLSEDATFEEYVALMLQNVLLYDEGGETAEMLEQLNSMYSDQAMTQDGDDYVMTMTASDYSYGYENSDIIELRFSFDGDEFTGVTMQEDSKMSYSDWEDHVYISSTQYMYSFTADGQADLSMSMTEDDVTYLSFDMSFTYTQTDELPAREPEEGSTVVSVDDITLLEDEDDYEYYY